MGLFGCFCGDDVDYDEDDYEDDDYDEEDEERSGSSEFCNALMNFTCISISVGAILLLVGIIIPKYWLIAVGSIVILGIIVWKLNLLSICGFGLSLEDIDDEDKVRKDARGYLRWKHNNQHVHRWVAERYIGKIEDDEVVHHIDGDKTNNHPDNLEIMPKHEHDKRHGFFWKRK